MNRRQLLGAFAASAVAVPLIPKVIQVEARLSDESKSALKKHLEEMQVCHAAEANRVNELEDDIASLREGMYQAWTVIANAYDPVRFRGEEDDAHPITVQFAKDWKKAADCFRDDHFHPSLKRESDG